MSTHPDDMALSMLFDGELDDDRRLEVQAHVARCDRCRSVLEGYETLDTLFVSGDVPPVPEDLTANVINVMEGPATHKRVADGEELVRRGRWLSPRIVGVSTAMVVFLATGTKYHSYLEASAVAVLLGLLTYVLWRLTLDIIDRRIKGWWRPWLVAFGGPSYVILAVAGTLMWFGTKEEIGPGRSGPDWVVPNIEFGENVHVFLSDDSLLSLLNWQVPRSWTPKVNLTKWRGGVFEQVAPATVVVRVGNGHGTGFIIGDDGLILTNYHVVAKGTSVDPTEAVSYCMVHLGRLTEQGSMELIPKPIRAYILAIDATRDLALLELDEVPDDLTPLPTVPFASANARPGQTCLIIGHPSSGLLWSLRQGLISALGKSPRDLVNVLLPMLASTTAERAQIEEMLRTSDSRDIVLTSCLANPGDSGGPLVNEAGELIGVTFGIPSDPMEQKFTYHIALNEVRDFLDRSDRTRLLLVPDAWSIGPMFMFLDPRILTSGVEGPTQLLLDLDGDTPQQLIDDQDFDELVGQRRFDAEIVLHYEFGLTAFYDTDNDGTMDQILIYSDRMEVADVRFRLEPSGEWRVDSNVSLPWLDPSLFEDRTLRPELIRMAKEFGLSQRVD